MPPENRRQTRDIRGVYDEALIDQLCERFLHVDCVPVGDGIEGETKGAKLLFLPLAQGVANLPSLSMVDFSGELVAELLPVQLHEDLTTKGRVVDVIQYMQGLDEASQMHKSLCQRSGTITDLKDTHDARRFQVPQLERPGEADQVFPVVNDELGVDHALRDPIEGAVVGGLVGTPQPCPTDIGQARAELISQKPEQAEDGIRIGGCIGHDLRWVELGFLFEEQGQDGQAIAQCARDHRSAQTRVLIRQHVVPSDAPTPAEVSGVRSSMDRALWGQKPQPVSRSGLPVSPMGGDGQFCVGGHDHRIGGGKCLLANEVLGHPRQAALAQCWVIIAHKRLKADVAGFCDENTAQAGFKPLNLSRPLAEVREHLCKARSVHHFEENVGDAALGHQLMNVPAQRDQTVGFIQTVQLRDHNLALAADSLKLQGSVLISARRNVRIGAVQRILQALNLGGPIERSVQSAANDALRILPVPVFQHPDRGCSEFRVTGLV